MLKSILAKISLFILLILSGASVYGQQAMQDVVYLKNGSIIRGVIISLEPSKALKIETADRSVFVFQMAEVEKIEKEKAPDTNRIVKTDNTVKYVDFNGNENEEPESGYLGLISLGYGFNQNETVSNVLKFDFINAYRINPYFSMGVGVGVRKYNFEQALLMPIYADLRVKFIKNSPVVPYLVLGIGNSIDADSWFSSGGLLANSSFGISIKLGQSSALNIGLAYESQKAKYEERSWYDEETDITLESIGLNFGLSF